MAAPAVPQEISLSLFGGMDTSLSAPTLPEGLSPANNDVIYAPGFVGSRPCLSKLFNTPFAGSPAPQALWGKKYLQANGLPLNLYLDSLGVLRQEDVTNSPNTYTTVQQLSPATKTFKSVTFDGVEYLAFSDGIHGVEVPRFYDTDLGVFDRISKDGVGTTTMTAADINTTVAITSVTLSNLATIAAAPNGATEVGNVVTILTTTPHGLVGPGVFVNIQGVAVAGYNGGAFQVGQIISNVSFTVINAGAGLAASGGGTVGLALVTVVTGTAHGLSVGDAVVIQGNNGSFNNGSPTTNPGTETPQYWTVVQVINPTTFVFGLSGPSGTINTTTLTNGGANGTVATGGMGAVGTHQAAVSFLWRGGYITKPSQPVYFTSLGNKQWQITNVPTGPTGVMARILHFTGAGGGNFFNIPINVVLPGNSLLFNGTLAPSTTVNSTWILDNTTTSVIVDFPDNTLFAAAGVDIPGNNLFALVTLAPCIGFDAYASRLFCIGEFNKVQGFLNMGFEGGIIVANQPLGWGTFGAGGALIAGPNGFGLAWQITGDGSGNNRGTLTQTAFQNYLFQAIIQPNTQYSFYVLANCSAGGLAGNIAVSLSSASTGFSSVVNIPINTVSSTTPKFVNAAFSLPTPATIPADLILTVCENGLNNGATVTLDENMLVFTAQPYRDTVMRGSYVNNPESFDGVTGDIGSEQDPNPIRDTYQIRQTLTILTSKRRHVTQDNNGEPGTWSVDQLEDNVGAASIHSATTGPGWAAWIQDTGKSLALRITQGGDSYKISREMKTYFKASNMRQKQRVWLCNVDDESQAGAGIMFMGVPQGEAGVISMAVLDYFESDTAGDIQTNRPLHIGFTGKMLTTDLGRKWTIWNLPMAFGAVLARAGGIDQFCVGSGNTSFSAGAFGNVYIFDPTKFTDDDYGQMFPSYTTYFFLNHDMETQMQLGGKRKFFGGQLPLSTFITGTGQLQITPLANTVANNVTPLESLAPWTLSQTQADDIEFPLEVSARRCAFRISVNPLPGLNAIGGPNTDVNFLLSHLSVPVMKHPVSALAGRNR